MNYRFKISAYIFAAVAFVAVGGAHAHADTTLGVTQITSVKTSAVSDNSFDNGWKWLFDVTIPSSETLLQMKFADWTNGTAILPTANNMRFYSSQSTDAYDSDHAVYVSSADVYGDALHIDADKDLNASLAGRQVQIAVETKVPEGTTNGSYGTSYGINTDVDPTNTATSTDGSSEVENTHLTVRKSSDNPDAGVLVADDQDTSDDFDVLAFEVKNSSNAYSDLDKLVIHVATSSASGSPAVNITDIIRRATLSIDGDDYNGDIDSDNTIHFDDLDTTIGGNETGEGILTVQLFGQENHYAASGESLQFSFDSSDLMADGSDIDGAVTGEIQTIVVNTGINVAGNSDNAVLTYNSDDTSKSFGTYTLKFDVSANGDDVYVPRSIATTSGSTTYAGVVVDPNVENTFSGTSTVSLTSTADTDGSFYVVHDGDTETFTAVTALDPSSVGFYAVGLDSVKYSTDADFSSLKALDLDQTDSDYRTDALAIQN